MVESGLMPEVYVLYFLIAVILIYFGYYKIKKMVSGNGRKQTE